MVMVADRIDAVVGVDTHTDTHTAAVLNPAGAVLAQLQVDADPAGCARLLAWAGRQAPGPRLLWAVDGARAHGVGLTRILRGAGSWVVEAPKPAAAGRRRGGKSDALDAVAAARAVLAAGQLGDPRGDGDREALRILLTCRRHDADTRTATVNLFKSLILTADDQLRGALRGLSTAAQVRTAAAGWPTGQQPAEHRIRRTQLAELAGRIRDLDTALRANKRQLRTLVAAAMPGLLDIHGVGPVTAATLLTAWSHPGRVRHEAAFAALAGVNPIPASSGRHTRHRLNRGGDRTLNAALHTIAKTRRRSHPATIAYLTRRRAEGKTDREITRCIKRYLARHLYRIMQSHTTNPPASPIT
ncbi:MAG TPA: IS110 family transposase [Micromonosporaceae bacterium]